MSRNQGPLVHGTQEAVLSITQTSRWSAVPGIVPAKTIRKRRAKNKSAGQSRKKNRK